jgi:hypothetical protein
MWKKSPRPRLIEDYEIMSEVARGAWHCVSRATIGAAASRRPEDDVAESAESSGAVARFRAEAEAVASLDQRDLPIYAVGEKDGVPFIA